MEEKKNILNTVQRPTRKSNWCKGKRMTAVHIWRPLAKKSTANQRCVISYWWLILTVAALLTVCEILSGVEVENRHFCLPYCDCSLNGGTPSNINVIYASLKSTLSALLFCCWQYRSIFIRSAVASQICKITRNSEKIRTYSSSRSSKVIDLGANQKCICNFLLVIDSNFGCISYHCRDTDT